MHHLPYKTESRQLVVIDAMDHHLDDGKLKPMTHIETTTVHPNVGGACPTRSIRKWPELKPRNVDTINDEEITPPMPQKVLRVNGNDDRLCFGTVGQAWEARRDVFLDDLLPFRLHSNECG